MPTNFLQGLRHGALTGSVDRISWNVIRRQHIIAFDGGHQLGRFVNELALSTKLRPNLAVRVCPATPLCSEAPKTAQTRHRLLDYENASFTETQGHAPNPLPLNFRSAAPKFIKTWSIFTLVPDSASNSCAVDDVGPPVHQCRQSDMHS